MESHCVFCGHELSGLQRKYCSERCTRDARNKRVAEQRVRVARPLFSECQWHGCQVTFPPQVSKFCSLRCKNKFEVSNTRRNNKARLVEYFGGACTRCGFSGHPAALHFHHRDDTKEFGLGQGGLTIAFSRLLKEAEKCELLCSNCHAVHHAQVKEMERRSSLGVDDGICDWGPCGNTLTGRRRKFCSKSCSTKKSNQRRRAKCKRELAERLGGRCSLCGFTGSLAALHFHHRDPRQKSFTLASFQVSWESLCQEADKCVLLCGNCHAQVHADPRLLLTRQD